MSIKSAVRDLLACLALANLIMIRVWLQLIPYDPGAEFWMAHSRANVFPSGMISTLIVGLGLWCLVLIVSRWQGAATALWPLMVGVTLFLALNGLRVRYTLGRHTLYELLGKGGGQLAIIAILLLMALVTFWMVRYWPLLSPHFPGIPFLLAPFLLVTFGQAALASWRAEPESAFIPHEHRNIQASANRSAMPVVWIIFDEWDYGIAFGRRPKELLLPELDRLRRASLFATNAYSPFDATPTSISALLTGKRLKMTKTVSAGEMVLTRTDGTTSSLNTESTIFDDMHARENRTALFGWAFPYSRLPVFKAVDAVKDYPMFLYPIPGEGLGEAVIRHLRTPVFRDHLSLSTNDLRYRHAIWNNISMQKDVTRYLQTNQGGGFTFLHYSIPHDPDIYNHLTHRYGQSSSPVGLGYLGNMSLVDLRLGEIRRTLEEAGTWDKTLIIISADHHWRYNNYDGIIDELRVPFMVKLPRQVKGIEVNGRFETVMTKELILQVVDGKLKTSEDVARWMRDQMPRRVKGSHLDI